MKAHVGSGQAFDEKQDEMAGIQNKPSHDIQLYYRMCIEFLQCSNAVMACPATQKACSETYQAVSNESNLGILCNTKADT